MALVQHRRTPRLLLKLFAAATVVSLGAYAWRRASLNAAHDKRSQACDVETLPLPVRLLDTQTTSLQLRSLGGNPEEDQPQTQQFLLCLTVGVKLKETVGKIVGRFDLQKFAVMLFHYDGQVDAWSDMPWHDAVVHVSAKAQSKWWFAKRFLNPDVVASYSLIFVWDEDIGVDAFDAARFVELVRDYSLAIAQPAIEHGPVSWPITRRIPGSLVHRCTGNHDLDASPCVEVMVPVFTNAAWRCVWALLPNDLVHAFGVDLAWHVCAGDAGASAIAIVDEQPVDHLGVPSLGEQGPNTTHGKAPWQSVHARRREEWRIWSARWEAAQRRAKAQRDER